MAPRLDPVRVEPPSGSVVTLEEVKLSCRVDHDDEDVLLAGMIASAVEHLDGWSGILRCGLLEQTWAESFRYFYDLRIPLRLAPVREIVSITYVDPDGNPGTVDPSAYRLHKFAGEWYVALVSGASWPSVGSRDDAATITYSIGYGSAADVPGRIKSALLLMICHLYENRSATTAQVLHDNKAVADLLAPFRRGSSNL